MHIGKLFHLKFTWKLGDNLSLSVVFYAFVVARDLEIFAYFPPYIHDFCPILLSHNRIASQKHGVEGGKLI